MKNGFDQVTEEIAASVVREVTVGRVRELLEGLRVEAREAFDRSKGYSKAEAWTDTTFRVLDELEAMVRVWAEPQGVK